MPRKPRDSDKEDEDGSEDDSMVVGDDEAVSVVDGSSASEEEELLDDDDLTSTDDDGLEDGDGADGPAPRAAPGGFAVSKRRRVAGNDDDDVDKAGVRAAARAATEREDFDVAAALARVAGLAVPGVPTPASFRLRAPDGTFRQPVLLENVVLHEHQEVALGWLAGVWEESRGALLCDQVGCFAWQEWIG
jgi:hypothetical protein